MLSFVYTRRAIRDLAGLPAADRTRIRERLKAYAAAPDAAGQDVNRLKGHPAISACGAATGALSLP